MLPLGHRVASGQLFLLRPRPWPAWAAECCLHHTTLKGWGVALVSVCHGWTRAQKQRTDTPVPATRPMGHARPPPLC